MEKVHTEWTKEMDSLFSDLLIKYEKHNKLVKWSSAEWDPILSEITVLFNKTFKLQFGNEDLRRRFGHYTKMLSDINNILKLKKFTWDFGTDMIVAEDWDDYVMFDENAIEYKDVSLKYVIDLKNIFEKWVREYRNEREYVVVTNEHEKGVNETEDMITADRRTTGDVIESSILGEKRRITRSSIGIEDCPVNTEGEKIRYTRSSILNAKRKLEDVVWNVTEKMKKIIEDVSDSDFEDVEVIKNKNKRKITGKKKIESESEDEEQSIIPFKIIKTRTSPKPLYDAMRALSPEQEKCIRKMGFGRMVRFNLEGIHLKLGYFLVDKFDEKNMVLNLTQGSIKITPESVHEMLGIPLGGIKFNGDCISENKFHNFVCEHYDGMQDKGDVQCRYILQYISKDTLFDKIDSCECVVVFEEKQDWIEE